MAEHPGRCELQDGDQGGGSRQLAEIHGFSSAKRMLPLHHQLLLREMEWPR